MTSYNYDADLVIWEQWTKTEKQKIAEQASTTINALHNKVIKIRKNMQQKLLACRYILLWKIKYGINIDTRAIQYLVECLFICMLKVNQYESVDG